MPLAAGGFNLWLDPSDSSTVVTWAEYFNLGTLSVSQDGGRSFERRQLPLPWIRDFTPTAGPALHVTDRLTGRYREYFNFLGENAPAVTDTEAFACDEPALTSPPVASPPAPASLSNLPAAVAGAKAECGDAESPALCLGEDDRFRVTVRWRDFAGDQGPGQPVPLSTVESGLFTFFSPSNWELMVKVLDGCDFNDHRWIFAAAVTNVEFTLEVTDQLTGETRSYRNPLGQSADAIIDTSAFGCGTGSGHQ